MSEILDLNRLIMDGSSKSTPRFQLYTTIIPDRTDLNYDPDGVLGLICHIASYDKREDAYEDMLAYMNEYPNLTFRVSQTFELRGIVRREDQEELLNIDQETWENINGKSLMEIERRRAEVRKMEEKREQLDEHIEGEKDEKSIHYLRNNFRALLELRSALDKTHAMYSCYLDRKRRCMKFINGNHRVLQELREVSEKFYGNTGDKKTLSIITNAIDNIPEGDKTGLPFILSEEFTFKSISTTDIV
jgi:hypothetical protein